MEEREEGLGGGVQVGLWFYSEVGNHWRVLSAEVVAPRSGLAGALCVESAWWGARVGAGRPVRSLVQYNPGERWWWVAWTRGAVVEGVKL